MELRDLKDFWNELGKAKPFRAICSGNKNWQIESFFMTGVQEIDALMKHIRSMQIELPHGIALDFGCGVGRTAQPLSKYFGEVHGVDIAHSMITLARRLNRHGDRCQYYVNERDDLGLFPDESFDFIYSIRTLQHMAPGLSTNYLREFMRLLRPGGLLVFQLTNERLRGPRRLIESNAPGFVEVIHRLRAMVGRPWMEMHCVEDVKVRRLVEEHGGTILETVRSPDSAPGYDSRDYYVLRRQRPSNYTD